MASLNSRIYDREKKLNARPRLNIRIEHIGPTYTVSQKRPIPLVCYNFDIREPIWIFLAETLPIKYAIKRWFTMPLK